jgi:hypothetical protein
VGEHSPEDEWVSFENTNRFFGATVKTDKKVLGELAVVMR